MTESEKLIKLAALLREEAKQRDARTQQKLAALTVAAAGLQLLRRKIYA